jgi:serine/threonine protein kinase
MKTLKLELSTWSIEDSEVIGKPGGFAKVHPGLSKNGESVAIKAVDEDQGASARRELQFAKTFAGEPTKHLIPILDCGHDSASGRAYIVMKRADGNLRDKMTVGTVFAEDDIGEIMTQIARGLLEAGDWIHRDLKPENILLYDSRWHLADFGISRLALASTDIHTLGLHRR